MSSSSYSPNYVDLEDPLLGAEEWPEATKRQALKFAESRLEADVNDGKPLTNTEPIHEFAVHAFATHLLASGAISPQSTKLGDIASSGQRREDYADQYGEFYESTVASINRARGDESADEDGDGTPDGQTSGSFARAVTPGSNRERTE